MIKSMTGYGTVNHESENLKASVEVKTLNSKFLDLNLRLPKAFSGKELEIRKIVSDILERGKVSLTIEYLDPNGSTGSLSINQALFSAYYNQLKALAREVQAYTKDLFKLALQSPEVMASGDKLEDNSASWELLKVEFQEALVKCDEFRFK